MPSARVRPSRISSSRPTRVTRRPDCGCVGAESGASGETRSLPTVSLLNVRELRSSQTECDAAGARVARAAQDAAGPVDLDHLDGAAATPRLQDLEHVPARLE